MWRVRRFNGIAVFKKGSPVCFFERQGNHNFSDIDRLAACSSRMLL